METILRQYPNSTDRFKLNSYTLLKDQRKASEELGRKILLGMTLLKLFCKVVGWNVFCWLFVFIAVEQTF